MVRSHRRSSTFPGARFSKVPRTFRARKAIRKITTCLFCKTGLFICCKGNKNKNNFKFRASRRHRFEDTKRNMSPEIRPKSFGTFEKQAPGTVCDWRTKQQMIQYKQCTLTQMTVGSNYVIAIATLNDWLKRLAPVFQPMQ